MSRELKVLLYVVLLLGALSFSILLGLIFVEVISDLSIAYMLTVLVGVLIGISISNLCLFIFYLDEPYDFEYPEGCFEPLHMVDRRELDYYKNKLSESWKLLYPGDDSNTEITE